MTNRFGRSAGKRIPTTYVLHAPLYISDPACRNSRLTGLSPLKCIVHRRNTLSNSYRPPRHKFCPYEQAALNGDGRFLPGQNGRHLQDPALPIIDSNPNICAPRRSRALPISSCFVAETTYQPDRTSGRKYIFSPPPIDSFHLLRFFH